MVIHQIEENKKKPGIRISPGESDEAAMARFAREYWQYVQYEREFYWKREVEQKKKKMVKKEDEAGPSTMIPVESDSSYWDDEEEEDEKLNDSDDPSKEEFWEQLKNDDEF